jgi:hypothetical protein
VDTINSEQLDISAVWDTISLVESIKGKREAVDVGVALTFTGIQATHPFEFHIKVGVTGHLPSWVHPSADSGD